MRILIDSHTNLYPLSRLPGGVADRIKDRWRIQAPVDFTFQAELRDVGGTGPATRIRR